MSNFFNDETLLSFPSLQLIIWWRSAAVITSFIEWKFKRCRM